MLREYLAMKFIAKIFVSGFIGLLSAMPSYAQDSFAIGYFSEWPLPAHYGRVSGAYDEVLGTQTEWVAFEDSSVMYSALNTGQIQVALSQGVAPTIAVATAGIEINIADIAVSYTSSDNCVAHPDLRFTPKNPKTIEGSKVGLPVRTVSHFHFLQTLAHFGVDVTAVEIEDFSPAQAAAALTQGKIDIACGWGPSIGNAVEFGTLLLNDDGKTDANIKNFDVIAVERNFGASNADLIAKFLQVTDQLNLSHDANPPRMHTDIASAVNMTRSMTADTLSGFEFPTIESKLGADWMSGGIQTYMKALADFFVDEKVTASALESYAPIVDKSHLETAAKLPLIAE